MVHFQALCSSQPNQPELIILAPRLIDGRVDSEPVLNMNSYLRERSMGPLLLYILWEPAGLNSKGLWERDEEPDDVLSR